MKTDAAQANELFQTAANKYQLLIESGIRNGELHSHLGNAYLQSGQLGRAIVNYERAKLYDPYNQQLNVNLDFAQARVDGQVAPSKKVATTLRESLAQRMRSANAALVHIIGQRIVIWTLVISSVAFWGLLILRELGSRLPIWQLVSLSLLLLILSATSVGLTETEAKDELNAVIVANQVRLHAGDGDQFDETHAIEAAQGHRVELLGQRGNWAPVAPPMAIAAGCIPRTSSKSGV